MKITNNRGLPRDALGAFISEKGVLPSLENSPPQNSGVETRTPSAPFVEVADRARAVDVGGGSMTGPQPAGTRQHSDQRRIIAISSLICLSLLYVLVELVPGRFVVTDEVFYKAAGRNWAMTGRFAAPEIVGRFTRGPSFDDTFLAQPPLYPFLFGVFTKLVGFGPRSCMFYDALIHLFLVWSVAATARQVFGLGWGLSALCGSLIFPIGTIGRSDELGIVFALLAAVAFRTAKSQRTGALIGGALLGCCCATCLGAFVFLGPLILWELLTAKQSKIERLLNVCAAGAAGLLVAGACVAPILVNHPSAYQQLTANASEQSGSLSFATGNGWRTPGELLQIWATGLRYGFEYVILTFGLLMLTASCRRLDRSLAPAEYWRVLLSAVSLGCIMVGMPGKCLYFLFPATWLLVTVVAIVGQASGSISRRRLGFLTACGACLWLAASAPYLQRKAIMWTLPSDQSLDANIQRVRAEIPAGAGVVSTEYWWALADRNRVYDILFSSPNVKDVDYIVVSGNGTGKPATPRTFKAEFEFADMQVVYSHLNPTPESLFGIRISRSAYGFGAYILKTKARN